MLLEILRHTFPKDLRFCKQSQILYAQLFTLSKRYKHKRFIPRSELDAIVASFEPPPAARILTNPVIRTVLFLRLINVVRVYLGKPGWLLSKGSMVEHQKLRSWLDRQVDVKGASAAAPAVSPTGSSAIGASPSTTTTTTTGDGAKLRPPPSTTKAGGVNYAAKKGAGGAATPPSTAPGTLELHNRGSATSALDSGGGVSVKRAALIERDRFDREVLAAFHMATMYHRMMILGAIVVAFLAFTVALNQWYDSIVCFYLRRVRRMSRQQIIDWFADSIAMEHLRASVHEKYESLLPPPTLTNKDGSEFYVNVVEMVSPDKSQRVLMIPCPLVGDAKFYQTLGKLMMLCEGVLLEEVPLTNIDSLPPSYFFTIKDTTFPVLQLSHRYYDLLRTNTEPPQLFGGGVRPGYYLSIMRGLLPMSLRCIYAPYFVHGSLDDARVGWGRLKEALGIESPDEIEKRVGAGIRTNGEEAHIAVRVLAVPWNVRHIVSLEASLYKLGWRPTATHKVLWLLREDLGERFCDHFGITE